jgi:hypothetical protein
MGTRLATGAENASGAAPADGRNENVVKMESSNVILLSLLKTSVSVRAEGSTSSKRGILYNFLVTIADSRRWRPSFDGSQRSFSWSIFALGTCAPSF